MNAPFYYWAILMFVAAAMSISWGITVGALERKEWAAAVLWGSLTLVQAAAVVFMIWVTEQ